MLPQLAPIKLFENILPQAVRDGLSEIAAARTRSNWRVGELAKAALDYVNHERETGAMAGVHTYHVWAAIHHYTDISPRRVEKLMGIYMEFPQAVRDQYSRYDFGYFEKAYEFKSNLRLQALEFLPWYEQEYGRVPSVSEFKFLFRKHILGENVESEDDGDDIAETVAAPSPAIAIGVDETGHATFKDSMSLIDMLANFGKMLDAMRRVVNGVETTSSAFISMRGRMLELRNALLGVLDELTANGGQPVNSSAVTTDEPKRFTYSWGDSLEQWTIANTRTVQNNAPPPTLDGREITGVGFEPQAVITVDPAVGLPSLVDIERIQHDDGGMTVTIREGDVLHNVQIQPNEGGGIRTHHGMEVARLIRDDIANNPEPFMGLRDLITTGHPAANENGEAADAPDNPAVDAG